MHSTQRTHFSLLTGLTISLAYVVTGKLGLLLALPPGYATAIFPAAGLAIAAAMQWGRLAWLWIFLGSLLLNLWAGESTLSWHSSQIALAIALCSCTQAALGGAALRMAIGADSQLDQARPILIFLLLAPLLCLPSATLSNLALVWLDVQSLTEAPGKILTWWIGDTLGLLIVLPLMRLLAQLGSSSGRYRLLIVAPPLLLWFALIVFSFIRSSQWEHDLLHLQQLAPDLSVIGYLDNYRASDSWLVLVLGLIGLSLLQALLLLGSALYHRASALAEQHSQLQAQAHGLHLLLALSHDAPVLDEAALIARSLEIAKTISGSQGARCITEPDASLVQAQSLSTADLASPLNVAISEQEQLRLVLQVWGRPTPYTDAEVLALQQLGQELWHILSRHRAEQAMMVAQQLTEAANAAKTRFLAQMSHEIRTPMNAIIGFTHLLQRTPASPVQADMLGKVAAASDRLLSIVNDVLDLSKIEAGKLLLEHIPFQLDAVFDPLHKDIAPHAHAKGLSFSISIPPELGSQTLMGDPLRLRQILLNLCANAIKYTDHGGIAILCYRQQENESSLLLRFSVSDTGCGVSPAAQQRLFTAFEQFDLAGEHPHGGSGLGLAISHRLSQMMGGQIGMESSPGQGSTFWFDARFSICKQADTSTQDSSPHFAP